MTKLIINDTHGDKKKIERHKDIKSMMMIEMSSFGFGKLSKGLPAVTSGSRLWVIILIVILFF